MKSEEESKDQGWKTYEQMYDIVASGLIADELPNELM